MPQRIARRVGLVRPWLPRAHPWFFFIYAATIVYHLWCAANGLLGSDRWFLVPALRVVNEVADNHWWALGNLIIAVGLYMNLHLRDFKYARLFLMLGLLWTSFRFSLVAVGWASGDEIGNTMPNLFLCMAVHAAQLGEPPANPASARS